MGKKPQRHSWREAKRLCRLNRNDIAMAKSLGFQPDGLIRSRPDPKQKWKLPVKLWIHDLHFQRFGFVIGDKPLAAWQPTEQLDDGEAARTYEEELYWEDYWDRNSDDRAESRPPASQPAATPTNVPDEDWLIQAIADGELPF
jgi:hypothetical protein